MAKKENKIEIISEETTVVSEKSNNEQNIASSNDDLNNLNIHDLYYIEKAINVVCKKYENILRNYDGSISTNSKEYEKFKSINTLHSRVINKMESELLKLI